MSVDHLGKGYALLSSIKSPSGSDRAKAALNLLSWPGMSVVDRLELIDALGLSPVVCALMAEVCDGIRAAVGTAD